MNNKPKFTMRDGAIKATVWENTTEKGTFCSVDLVRSYKDKNGEWKETTSLTGGDILRAANLLNEAYQEISTSIDYPDAHK